MSECKEFNNTYQELLKQSDADPTVFSFYYDWFTQTYKREPTFREIPGSNTEKYIREFFNIKGNSLDLQKAYALTQTSNVKDLETYLNQKFNDKNIELTELEKTAIINIENLPNKFQKGKDYVESNLDKIKFFSVINNKVSIDKEAFKEECQKKNEKLYDPSYTYSNMLYAIQNNINVDALPEFNVFNNINNTDDVLVSSAVSAKNGHEELLLFLNKEEDKGFWELQKDSELGYFTVHMKTATKLADGTLAGNTVAKVSTPEDRMKLYKKLRQLLPEGACLSTWSGLSQGGVYALNKLGKNELFQDGIIFEKVGTRQVLTKNGDKVNIPIYQKKITSVQDSKYLYSEKDLQFKYNELNYEDTIKNSKLHILNILDTLEQKFNVKVNTITTEEIMRNPEMATIPGQDSVKAFIYKGEIYINTDLATVDSKVHELMHLFLGSLKFNKSELYNNIIDKSKKFKGVTSLSDYYSTRAYEDRLEEIFVTEVSKWLTGNISNISSLKNEEQYEILQSIYHMLDGVFHGKSSVEEMVYIMPVSESLSTLAKQLQSDIFIEKSLLQDSTKARFLGNLKESLIKDSLLNQICDA